MKLLVEKVCIRVRGAIGATQALQEPQPPQPIARTEHVLDRPTSPLHHVVVPMLAGALSR